MLGNSKVLFYDVTLTTIKQERSYQGLLKHHLIGIEASRNLKHKQKPPSKGI